MISTYGKPFFVATKLISIMAFIAGCVIASSDLENSIDQTSAFSEETEIPIPSNTLTPTLSSTPSPIIPSATITAAPTWTLMPTLPIEAAEKVVTELFANNGNCQLPCWWGITPGQTSWQEAHEILSPLVFGDIYYSQNFDVNYYASVKVPVAEQPSKWALPKYIPLNFYIRDEIVESIDFFVYDIASVLDFPVFLDVLGVPKEVWVITFIAEEGEGAPFQIVFYYPEQGMIALYQFGDGSEQVNNVARTCSITGRSPFIGLWDPELELNFSEAFTKFIHAFEIEEYIELEEATGVSIETFIEELKDQDSQFCLESPLDLWYPFG